MLKWAFISGWLFVVIGSGAYTYVDITTERQIRENRLKELVTSVIDTKHLAMERTRDSFIARIKLYSSRAYKSSFIESYLLPIIEAESAAHTILIGVKWPLTEKMFCHVASNNMALPIGTEMRCSSVVMDSIYTTKAERSHFEVPVLGDVYLMARHINVGPDHYVMVSELSRMVSDKLFAANVRGALLRLLLIVAFATATGIASYKALKSSQYTTNVMKAMLSSIPDGLIVMRGQNEIVLASDSIADMFGYDKGDQFRVDDLVPDEYIERHNNGIVRHQATGHSEVLGDTERPLKKGKRKDQSLFDIRLIIIERNVEKELLYFGAITDMTQYVENEKKIIKQNVMMKQIGYMWRHDTVNHLTPVATAIEYMQSEGYSEEAMDLAGDEIKSAIDLCHSLADWSKNIEAGNEGVQKEKVDLTEVFESVSIEGADITIGDLGHALCDRGLMLSVARNLMENAQKYGSREPTISITREGQKILFLDNADGFGCINDQYDHQYALNLMKPLQRGGSDVAGSGLGCANMQAAIDAHGWDLKWKTDCQCGETLWTITIRSHKIDYL